MILILAYRMSFAGIIICGGENEVNMLYYECNSNNLLENNL